MFDLVFQQIALAVATLAVVSAAPASSSPSKSNFNGFSLINIQCTGSNSADASNTLTNTIQSGGNFNVITLRPSLGSGMTKPLLVRLANRLWVMALINLIPQQTMLTTIHVSKSQSSFNLERLISA